MSNRKLLKFLPLLIVLAVSGLVVGARLLLSSLAGGRPAAVVGPDERGADEAAEPATAPLATPRGADPEAEGETRVTLQLADGEEEAGGEPLPELTGRVEFAHPLPADEELLVVEFGEPEVIRGILGAERVTAHLWETGKEGEVSPFLPTFVRVAEDGSFRIPLREPDSTTGHLAVLGRYTYSLATTEVRLDDPEPVLTGKLGAWIVGELRARGVDSGDERLAGIDVELGPDITAGFDTYGLASVAYDADLETGSDGRFEFRGVPDSFVKALLVEPDDFAPFLELGIQVTPGERLDLPLELQDGATVRGTVLTADGAPLAGATVNARLPGAMGQAAGRLSREVTDEEGRFELKHVITGRRLSVEASPEGYETGQLTLEDKLRDGQVVAGLVLTCDQGLEVSGQVVNADGTPAERVRMRLQTDLSSIDPARIGFAAASMTSKTEYSQEDGRFRFTSVGAGPFVLTASVGEVDPTALVRMTGVEAGATGLVLRLEPSSALRGQLVTSAERAIQDFRVEMVLQGSEGLMGLGGERWSRSFDGLEDGGFEARGLLGGEWSVTVRATGFAPTPARLVTLPQPEGSGPEVFELVPAASISGRVLDTTGRPVSGATVKLDVEVGERVRQAMSGGGPTALSDHRGEFLLESVAAGSISVVAALPGYASSEPRPLMVAPGELVEDIDLSLRTGGTVEGRVLDDEGDGAPGRMIVIQSMPSYLRQHMTTAGSDGEFRFEHLEPGAWQIIAMGNALTGEVQMDSEGGLGNMLDDMKMDTVEVIDGELVEVTLGRPAEDPVTTLGNVRAGDEPVAGAVLSFAPDGCRGIADLRLATTDANGDFLVKLEQRGAYLVTVQSDVQTGATTTIEFDEVIPEGVAQHRLQLRMPLGGIRGRVLGPGGEPEEGVQVTLNVDEGVKYGSVLGGNYVQVQTDADGTFELRHLRPGRYAVSAGGVAMGALFGASSRVGREVQSGLVVSEGKWLEDVEFRLAAAHDLEGRVTGLDGGPVAGAAIFVRDEAGQLLDRFSFVTTDAAGVFRYRGVAEGRYTVTARKGALISPPSEIVRVGGGSSGELTEAEVQLDEGTDLLVRVVDRTGADLKARVRVQDERGFDVSSMMTMEDVLQNFGEGFSSKEQRIGPLSPGRYRVTATLGDGRSTDKRVSLTGQTERRVTLRIR